MKVTKLVNKFLLEAEEGFTLRRIADGWIAGSRIFIGMTYYLNGEKLEEPIQSLPEHYEEIPIEGYVFPDGYESLSDTNQDIVVEETDERSDFYKAMDAKIKASNAYAESIKSVSLYGQEVWKTPSERDNYMSTLQSAQRLGMTEISFLGFNMQITDAIRILDMVNVWAFKVTAVKESHERSINALSSIEEVEAYDFTLGYPDKIVIE